MAILATGDIKKLGGFYLNNVLQTRPTYPWRNGSTPSGGPAAGNIPTYTAGHNIEIKDTPSADANKIQWVEVNDNGKKYYVADRNLLVSVSWDDLNSQNLITGKTITIDGQKYLLRVLTGGANYRSGSDAYSGGTSPNEWDRWICNEAGLSGLKTPSSTDLDSSMVESDRVAANNSLWNWYYVYSWTKETYTGNSSSRVLRGYDSARYWSYNTSSSRYVIFGWRPVLEVLNSGPLISGPSENLGNKTSQFDVTYSATEPEGESFTVVEKLNGTQIGTTTATASLTNRVISIDSEKYAALALNITHTITVEATDSAGNKTVKSWTFVKTNAAPKATIVEPKGDLVNISIVNTITPVLVHQFSDSDAGDVQSAYQYVIEDTNGNTVYDSGKVASTQSFMTVPEKKLNWATRYKFKVRVWDKFDVASEYTDYQFFLPNRAPSVSNLTPGSTDAESPAPAGVAPLFKWEFSDLDLEAQGSYSLQIYKTVDDSLVYNTSRVYQNVQQHQVPNNILQQGTGYYAELTVYDPNGLSAQAPRVYLTTNATPTAPVPTLPVNNYRTSARPTFSAIVGSDTENDKQHFIVQIATDENFTKELLEFSSAVERAGWKVAGFDIPTEGVNNDVTGQTVSFTSQVDLETNKRYYWRIAAIDATTGAIGAYSPARTIRCGNKMEFELSDVIDTGNTAARRILVAMEANIATDGTIPASVKVEVSNNANDVNPTWEDATAEYNDMDYYEFTNTSKTAVDYAVSVRITINANDSLGDIYVDDLGITFD